MEKAIFKQGFYDKLKRNNIDVENPKTIQDKINWLKIYDSTPLKGKCADKIAIHDYCKEILGKDICVPILKIYNNVDEIKLDELPDKFVLKCNHGYNMNIICKDKRKFNLELAKNKLNTWLHTDFGYNSYQPHYSFIKPRIFAEQYLSDKGQTNSLIDYKFWCFNGEPKHMTVNSDNGHGDILYYDMNYNRISLERKEYPVRKEVKFQKPVNFDKMVEYAKELSKNFIFVRVDFYEVNGQLYLGELTFTPGNGFFHYKNKEDDLKIGKILNLSNKIF